MSPEQLKPLTDALLEMDVILRERKPGLALAESLEKAISAYKDLKEAEESALSEDRINEYRINFQNAMAELSVSIKMLLISLRSLEILLSALSEYLTMRQQRQQTTSLI